MGEGTPFDVVTDELDTMMAIIDKEEKEDQAQKAWCDSEREEQHSMLEERQSEQESLEGIMTEITDDIENAETGLKKQLSDKNDELAQNRQDQAESKENRGLENVAYQKNVNNLEEAANLVLAAKDVLKKFYDWLHTKQGPHHYEKYEG